MTYNESESVCEQYNGHLASIHSADENDFIQGIIYCNKLKIFYGSLGLHEMGPWIGLYYDNQTNAFQWSDNTTVNYTNFYQNDTSFGYCVVQDGIKG